jgi:hypothetical protein
MQEAGEGEVLPGDTTGIKCSRCTKRGHFAVACKTEIFCVICDKKNDHVNHKCPILKMPRPVAHAVGYAVHGLGFYHIPRPPLPRAKKDSRTALVSVEGGNVPLEEVKRQLERLFPGKWAWELKAQEENSFLAKFPSKIELQRAVAFGGVDIRGEGIPAGVRLKFEVWQEKEVGFLLPKVWVRVFGPRRELYEFLELWEVGSMLGSTQIVDMETTRKNSFGRILVVVLNSGLIPEQLDVVIGDHYFELEFEVERMGIDENGEEAEFDWPKGARKDDGEVFLEEGQQGEEEFGGRTAKKLKRGVGSGEGERGVEISPNSEDGFVSWKEQVQNMTKDEFEVFLRAKAGDILNRAADEVMEEMVDKVLGEEDEGHQEEGGTGGGCFAWRGQGVVVE